MRREAIRAFEIAMILQGEFMMRELSSNQTVNSFYAFKTETK
jgi:hypothetical protein